MKILWTIMLWCGVAGVAAAQDDATVPVDYDRQVRPLLARSCFECHGPDDARRQAGLRLDRRDSAIGMLDSGLQAIVPGNAAESELMVRVASDDEALRMPPPETTPSLPAAERAILQCWIDAGAPFAEHWSYVAPHRPSLPSVERADWPRNPIDHFILARLEEQRLEPSPPADKARLLRRLYLDLIGLPPTIEEVDRFLADQRPDAYDEVVDELLASPRYGERWASPWLDLARHADSNGYQRDGFREVWAYRDWVIDAINRDMPFEQFTIEQLAGDLLPDATWRQKVATGFHRSTTVSVEAGTDQEEDRVLAIVDRVNTTATIWLGSTVACAQCHHHKYDPWRQQDYYRLFAYFNQTQIETEGLGRARREFVGPTMPLPEPPIRRSWRVLLSEVREVQQARLDEQIETAVVEQPAWEAALRERNASGRPDVVPDTFAPLLQVPHAERSAEQLKFLRDRFLAQRPEIRTLRKQLKQLDVQLAALEPSSALVMRELEEPRETFLLERGDFLSPAEKVTPGVPDFLHAMPDDAPPNRLGLARWLVDANNPLVGRVTVNRWWSQFFGQGLVSTPEDFGTQGERPTHPDLLDWLAVELVASGWSRKSIHRLIVTSATYQQAALATSPSWQRDPRNQWLARGPRVRLAAEAVRDNALAISGLLSTEAGGPPIRPWQPDGIWRVTGSVDNTYRMSDADDRHRRGVYVMWRRSSPYPSFVNFDAPDRTACVVARPRTNTPLQALTLMNDQVFVEAAVALAARVLRDRPDADLAERAEYAFRLCLARQPDNDERARLEEIIAAEIERCQSDIAAAERLLEPYEVAAELPAEELAAWFHVAAILLNLDETITKG